MNIEGFVIEGRQGTDNPGHHRHRMGVVLESIEKLVEASVDHRVAGDRVLEIRQLLNVRKLRVQQQVTDLQKAAMLGELLNRVAAIGKLSIGSVQIGDGALAAFWRSVICC